MGKCKICGTGIEDTEDMCEDCKALEDVDLIKSDDELEELLNSVMHSHTSYPNNDGDSFLSSVEMTIDPVKEIDNHKDSDEISVQLDSIANDLLEEYSLQDGQDEVVPSRLVSSELNIQSSYNLEDEEPLSVDSVSKEEEEPFSMDELSKEEEPFSMDALSKEEEEPFSIDALSKEEEEPFSVDALSSEEEEPFSVDALSSEEEEPFSVDALSSEEEEPFSIDALLGEEEEPFSMDTLSSEEEDTFSIDSLSTEESAETEEPFAIDSFMDEAESDLVISDTDSPISAVHSEETVRADNDLYAGIPGFEGIFDGIEDDDKEASSVSDIFADVLGTVSNYGADEEENNGTKSEKDEKKSSKKKKDFIKGLFENINNEETEKEFLKEKELAEVNAVQKAAKKEQKIADAAAKKAKKAEAKKSKLAVKATKKAAKKAEIESKLAEEEQDHSKINKKGATVVFVAFAALCAIIILGTNTFSYSASIGQAEDYFARKKYTKAYKEISGVDIKKDDQELANKIKTVMYVNKEYDSYNNYYAIQYYAEALNSLLNGLTKYDVYLDRASELGVKSDLQYVKSQILEELQEKYNLDEDGAKKITSIEDQEKYSDKVFAIAEKLVAKKKK
ncbi:hypothetical protein SAMN02746066_01304 [Anaerosporobacter mobilis DSM 15930]|jgi:uncharacterized protein YqcC (DUF446 family)|uniref:Uncharacterized protein n=1 Tax=Anaerosporobacter mobilis DSM 15930 TaxID=1120996 RepID=A0A1M7H5H2_9FIRM|nr:hypothetical protein [Anaerosporobacter mobilis]SHM23805.1 hypothetical protein SAMN02746066_01304 [Anaerosporobacter mobilis DSM 15930]